MTNRPWMPLYVGDYLADTRHLSTAEHGAYMLLILHYWRTGGLPDNDERLRRITGMTAEEWACSKDTLATFFDDNWKHKRIEFELTQAAILSSAGRAGGIASGAARRNKGTIVEQPLNDQGNDPPTKREALHSHSPSHVSKISKKVFLSKNGGEQKANGWSPPRHGAASPRTGRVYVIQGTPEWTAYADDYRSVHGIDPEPNKHGGKWFKTIGEAKPEAKSKQVVSRSEDHY